MIVPKGLEYRFGAPDIMFGGAIRCDQGSVNDSLFATFSIEREICRVVAVARRVGGLWLLLVADKVFAVAGYNCSHIGHATVAEL